MFIPRFIPNRDNAATRADRLFQILTVLYDARFTDTVSHLEAEGERGVWAGWRSTYEVTKRIGLKTPRDVRRMLHELRDAGLIVEQLTLHRKNVHKSMWACGENARWSKSYKERFDDYFSQLRLPETEGE